MKKTIFIILMLLMAVLMTSCSSAPAESTLKPEKEDQTQAPAKDTEQQTQAPAIDTEEQTTKEPEEVYTPTRKIRISCVGDSITYGVGASNAGLYAYPAQLRRMLGSDYVISNYGRSSSYMINPKDYTDYKFASERSVAYTSTSEYQYSITSNPDLVFICLGANDAYISNTNSGIDQAKYFYDSAVALAKKYQSLDSKPTVVFMYPPARYDAQYRLDYIKNTIIPMIDKAAAECGCEVIDLFSLTEEYAKNKNTKYISTDGIHLADEGYKVMAEAVYKVAKEYRLPQ